MKKMREIIFSLIIGISMVTSQCPTESEYQRAKTAITNMIENSQDLPRCVRLGKIIEFHKHDLGISNNFLNI